ncbi:MAG: hypothetical protein IMY82_03530 [Chloroflexi bacterium]|nr:hypothetical protein [Chloroflexota bacterium]
MLTRWTCFDGVAKSLTCCVTAFFQDLDILHILMKPASYSELKPATCSYVKSAGHSELKNATSISQKSLDICEWILTGLLRNVMKGLIGNAGQLPQLLSFDKYFPRVCWIAGLVRLCPFFSLRLLIFVGATSATCQ